MDNATIITLTIVAVVALALLVLAGVALSVASYTQLLGLLRLIGSWAVQLLQADPRVQTTSSTKTVRNTKSVPTDDIHITQETPD